MKEAFFALAARLASALRGGETLLCNLSAERSDFVRFNRAQVRQAGSVEQRVLALRLVRGRRHAAVRLTLAGTRADDEAAQAALGELRRTLDDVPEDPWLLVNEAPQASERVRRGALAPARQVVDEVLRHAQGHDFVGIYAGGTLYRGFAGSLGQRHWHEVDSFNLDWSVYREADQAVKAAIAGARWRAGDFAEAMARSVAQLGQLALPRRELPPGEYRAYLAPRALEEIVGLLSWGGFSARARATRQSPLLRMQEGATLSPRLDIAENTAEGIAPGFQAEGFVKPPRVELVRAGRLGDALVSPRSAREYGLATNGANAGESPESIEVSAGELASADALAALERGLYVSNLWYLNFSDRAAGRITGMTRFATFQVEGGRIAGPIAPLRFDDSIYRLLGSELVALTRERELLLDASTYGERSSASARLPGALVGAMRFTL
ncbi:MAG TPA: metallopeptidase TldD-related protein [Burkholderiales bacterium]